MSSVPCRLGRLLAGLALTAVLLGAAHAAVPGFGVAPPAPWVQVQAVPAPAPSESAGRGVQYLLLDEQVQAAAAERASYRHLALRVTAANGLEEASQVSVHFDPAYERLTLHHVRVWRGDRVTERLDPARVRVLQRERELERRILDGSAEAHLVLDDIRVGDIVEHAYTVSGANPVFGSHRFGHLNLQWASPVDLQRYRLLWPAGRPLQLRSHNGAEAPVRRLLGAVEELVWERRDIPARVLESDTPGWFDPYASATWSSFADWRAVVDWALPLYRPPAAPGPRLRQEVDTIAAAHAGADERIAAALRFVQGEIRYLGVEIGAHSHQPHAPELVLVRRFGDCKDKTLLMVSLLRALGIEAYPALVHSRAGRALDGRLPSPGWFDHVIVQARAGGRTWWLDPTLALQPSALSALYQPDYGHALVLAEGSDRLVSMTDRVREDRRRVRMHIDASAGPGQPAQLTVTTVLEGRAAERTRETMARTPRVELAKQYLNFYAGDYPSIQAAAPLEVKDDVRSNRLTTVEQYRIAEFWRRPPAGGRLQASVFSPEVRDYLRQPQDRRRTGPLSLAHPVDVSVTTEIVLHQPWQATTPSVVVNDAAFEFRGAVQWPDKHRVILTDSYLTRADHVTPERMEEHLRHLDRAWRELGYTLYEPAGVGHLSSQVLATGPLMLALLALGAWALVRWDPAPLAPSGRPMPAGLGGWLIVALLAMGVGLARALAGLRDALPAYAADGFAELTTPGTAAYHPLWAPVLYFELLLHLAQLTLFVVLLVLFFRRRSSLPRVWVGALCVLPVLWTLSMLLAMQIPALDNSDEMRQMQGELLRAYLSAAVWSAYFLRSDRVRNTFVRRRLAPPVLQPTTPQPVA